MMLDVFLRDGRTVLRFRSRATLRRLMAGNPAEEDLVGVTCWRRYEGWYAPTGTIAVTGWEQVRWYHLSRNAISHIRVIGGAERQAFEAQFADAKDRLATALAEAAHGG